MGVSRLQCDLQRGIIMNMINDRINTLLNGQKLATESIIEIFSSIQGEGNMWDIARRFSVSKDAICLAIIAIQSIALAVIVTAVWS